MQSAAKQVPPTGMCPQGNLVLQPLTVSIQNHIHIKISMMDDDILVYWSMTRQMTHKKKTPANFRYIYYISTVISRLCVLTSILLSVISTSAITDCVLSIFPTQNCINNLSVFTQMVYPKITVYQRVPKMFLQLFGG